jgi:hypothetical protein
MWHEADQIPLKARDLRHAVLRWLESSAADSILAASMYLSTWLVFDSAVMPPSSLVSITTLFLFGAAAGLMFFEYLRLLRWCSPRKH